MTDLNCDRIGQGLGLELGLELGYNAKLSCDQIGQVQLQIEL